MAQPDYQRRAEILKAMAHPSRLMIIDALAQGERCVCELQELVGSSMPTVSRHLSLMRAAGIVAGRRKGSQIFYRLLVPCVTEVFTCVERVLDAERERVAAGA